MNYCIFANSNKKNRELLINSVRKELTDIYSLVSGSNRFYTTCNYNKRI